MPGARWRVMWLLAVMARLSSQEQDGCDFRVVDVGAWDEQKTTSFVEQYLSHTPSFDEPHLFKNAFSFVNGSADKMAFVSRFGHHPFTVSLDVEATNPDHACQATNLQFITMHLTAP